MNVSYAEARNIVFLKRALPMNRGCMNQLLKEKRMNRKIATGGKLVGDLFLLITN